MPGRNRKGKRSSRRSGGGGGGRMAALVKAITDLKIATALNPTPQIPDPPRLLIKPKRYTMVQNFSFGTVSILNGGTPTLGAAYVTLSSFGNSSSFTAIFDQWRVLQFTCRFVPQVLPGIGIFNIPPLLTVVDHDDSVAPASTNALREYDTLQEVPFPHYVERTVVPKFVTGAYDGSSFAGPALESGWVDCAAPTIRWYGVKYAIDSAPASTTVGIAYAIEISAVLQFRAVR